MSVKKAVSLGSVALIMACCMAAGAEQMLVTLEGTAYPYSMDESLVFNYGEPFPVTINACFDVVSYSETPDGSGGWDIEADGTVLWWEVTDPIETVHYDAAAMTAPYGQSDNFWYASANVVDVMGTLVPTDADIYAYVAGWTNTPSSTSKFQAMLSTYWDGDSLTAYAFQSYWTSSGESYWEEGWEFDGYVTGVQPCEPIVPEPASLSLLGLGIGALAYRRIRRR